MRLPGSGGRRPQEPPDPPEYEEAPDVRCQGCGEVFKEYELDANRVEIGNGGVVINLWCPDCGDVADEQLVQEPSTSAPKEHRDKTDMVTGYGNQ